VAVPQIVIHEFEYLNVNIDFNLLDSDLLVSEDEAEFSSSQMNEAENCRNCRSGCRGRELYRQLKKDSIKIATDDVGKRYATIEQTAVEKNHNGGPSAEQQWQNSTRIYDCRFGANSLIAMLELFLSKLNPNCKWLFQQCRPKTNRADPVWYKNEPLGVNTLGSMMKTISGAATLSKTYTNHCVRSTTITVLFNAGVNTQNIQARTGHRSLEGLQPYIGHSTAEHKREEAGILQAAINGTSAVRQAIAVRAGDAAAGGEVVPPQSCKAELDAHMSSLLTSGQFNNCNFNVTINNNNSS